MSIISCRDPVIVQSKVLDVCLHSLKVKQAPKNCANRKQKVPIQNNIKPYRSQNSTIFEGSQSRSVLQVPKVVRMARAVYLCIGQAKGLTVEINSELRVANFA